MLIEEVSVNQLTHVIAQATAPAFLLGAVAAFIAILTARQHRIIDRVRILYTVQKEDVGRKPLLAAIPGLRRRARLLNRAVFFAVCSAITVTFLILLSFIGALVSFPHEKYVGVLFVLACGQFCVSLAALAFEILLSLPSIEFHA
jgi:hypothetical protein